jgi:hypothetical protein
LGCVTEFGDEFYCELSDTYDVLDCSDFVVTNVLPLLYGGDVKLTAQQAAYRLKNWIESFENEVVFV